MNKHKFTNIFAFQTPACASLLIAFLGLLFGALSGIVWLLVAALVISGIIILYGHYAYSKSDYKFTRSDLITVKILIGVYGTLTLSLLCSSMRILITDCFYFSVISLFVAFAVFAALTANEVLYLLRVVYPRYEGERKRPSWRTLLPIGILAVILVALNIEIFDTWFRWDSYDYYYYFQNVSYTNLGRYSNLRPANHAAYGCSAIFLIIDGIIGNAATSLYLINVLMLVVSAFAFWRIVGLLFPHWSAATKIATASILAFSPFLFGLAWSISLETYLAFGLVMFFWGRVEKLPLLQVASALLICFSKETGAVLMAAIVFVHLLLNFALKCNRSKSFLEKLELPISLPILGFGLFWLGEFMLNSWTSSNAASIDTTVEVNFNNFDFNMTYIIDRVKSLVFTNFTWLVIALIFVGFAVGAIRHLLKKAARESDTDRIYYTAEVLAGLVASLVPLLLFVTYNHIRYAAPTAILLVLLLPIAVDMLVRKDRIRVVLCGAVAACFLVQSYTTVDPMMHLLFNKINKGNGSVIYTENRILESTDDSVSVSVSAQYNRELMYYDEAFDQLLESLNCDDNTVIVFPDEYRAPTVGGYVSSEYHIFGFGYKYMKLRRYVSWDAESGTRYLSRDPDDELKYRCIASSRELIQSLNNNERCIYLQLPFCDMEAQATMLRNFKVTEVARSSIGGWELVAYEITK